MDGSLYKFDGINLNKLVDNNNQSVPCDINWSRKSDKTAVYAVNQGNIGKLPHSGGNWTLIYTGGDASSFRLTQNYVVVQVSGGLKAIPKDPNQEQATDIETGITGSICNHHHSG